MAFWQTNALFLPVFFDLTADLLLGLKLGFGNDGGAFHDGRFLQNSDSSVYHFLSVFAIDKLTIELSLCDGFRKAVLAMLVIASAAWRSKGSALVVGSFLDCHGLQASLRLAKSRAMRGCSLACACGRDRDDKHSKNCYSNPPAEPTPAARNADADQKSAPPAQH